MYFFVSKRLMKKWILLSLLTAAAVACGLEEVSRRPDGGAGDVWVKPGGGGGSDDSPVTYITVFDYPEGYDWRKDPERGTVRCSLVVYADGSPVMKLPVGDAYEVSSDPDMHRMAGGHLYTDFSTDSQTVIKKDGKEIMRYDGREMICGLVADGDDVYTLGHPRSGEGFSYRKNGEVIISRSRGRSFGRLHQAADSSIRFAFSEPIAADGGELERYYVSTDGKVSQTAVREDVKKVWDVVSYGDEVCYLASVVGISSPVLFSRGDMKAMNMPESSKLLTCSIICDDESLYVEGLYFRDGRPLTSGLWKENGEMYMFADGMTASSVCMGGDGVCCVLNSPSPLKQGIIYRCGETYSMPSGYASVGGSPAIVIDGILHVGLSSLSGAHPLIWKDGETDMLRINGFISTISTHG